MLNEIVLEIKDVEETYRQYLKYPPMHPYYKDELLKYRTPERVTLYSSVELLREFSSHFSEFLCNERDGRIQKLRMKAFRSNAIKQEYASRPVAEDASGSDSGTTRKYDIKWHKIRKELEAKYDGFKMHPKAHRKYEHYREKFNKYRDYVSWGQYWNRKLEQMYVQERDRERDKLQKEFKETAHVKLEAKHSETYCRMQKSNEAAKQVNTLFEGYRNNMKTYPDHENERKILLKMKNPNEQRISLKDALKLDDALQKIWRESVEFQSHVKREFSQYNDRYISDIHCDARTSVSVAVQTQEPFKQDLFRSSTITDNYESDIRSVLTVSQMGANEVVAESANNIAGTLVDKGAENASVDMPPDSSTPDIEQDFANNKSAAWLKRKKLSSSIIKIKQEYDHFIGSQRLASSSSKQMEITTYDMQSIICWLSNLDRNECKNLIELVKLKDVHASLLMDMFLKSMNSGSRGIITLTDSEDEDVVFVHGASTLNGLAFDIEDSDKD